MSDADSDETLPYPADEEQMGTAEEETLPDNRDTAPARKRKRRRKRGKKQAGPSETKKPPHGPPGGGKGAAGGSGSGSVILHIMLSTFYIHGFNLLQIYIHLLQKLPLMKWQYVAQDSRQHLTVNIY